MDDLIVFENESDDKGSEATPWKVLIVDDDDDVHRATFYSLKGTEVLGRRLDFISAFSATEAMRVLKAQPDIAVILLDVVMEDETAGLRLVKTIRQELNLPDVRIVLRTGQPGYAPEEEAIRDYDINDYKAKNELTHTRLLTTITAAIRSFAYIRALAEGRKDLERIVDASADLMSARHVNLFATQVTRHAGNIFALSGDTLVLTTLSDEDDQLAADLHVVVSSGRFSRYQGMLDSEIPEVAIRHRIQMAKEGQRSVLDQNAMTLFSKSQSGNLLVAYLEGATRLKADHALGLLDVYASTVALSLENVGLMARLKHFAYYDPLLDIPNRLYFAQHIDEKLEGTIEGWLVSLVDIDQFSAINDTIGSHHGDELLRRVRDRLLNELSKSVVLARISGDTFGLMGPRTEMAPERIRQIFTQPFTIEGRDQLLLSVTQGYVALADQIVSGHDAIKRANIALKRAKSLFRGEECRFTLDMARETEERVKLLHNLRQAFEAQNLYLVYQPQVDMCTGEVTGFEALMRWRTRSGENISPLQFIGVAENSGLIVPLGEWAMRVAMAELVILQRKFGRRFRMGLNVSMVQFRHHSFLSALDQALADLGVDPSDIELEITESVAMLDIGKVRRILSDLKSRGCSIAIDDFGTGFSSLSYLEHLPIQRLKIDKSFVDKLGTGLAESNLPEMIIQLGRNLKMDVIAEGVETREQADRLIEIGCQEAQGYLFAKPMADEALYEWLASRIKN
ncbi:MAG: EAL domain-containing protein [Hahellaceae bacterium]|nr:EAL domain-containing protein [Hahellaceae bacterium]